MSFKLYTNLSDTMQSMDYKRKDIKPPTRADFGNEPRFTTLRHFEMINNQGIDIQKKLKNIVKLMI